MKRREFIGISALAGTLSACMGGNGSSSSPTGAAGASISPSEVRNGMSYSDRMALTKQPLPTPADSGIDHIVLVVMENRSFDHFLGWVPGAEGVQGGRKFTDAFGKKRDSFQLSKNPEYGFQGCGKADPNHSYEAGRIHLNSGAMDGFLRSADTNKTEGDLFPIGYYGAEDLDFHRQAALNYTVCDYYFSGILSETYPNRIYLHCGETDRLSNTMATIGLPSIWDRLAAKNISANYFFSDIPFTALFGQKLLSISRPIEAFYGLAAAGQLPSFSMIDPKFGGEDNGLTNDDHPHADVRNGQIFLNQVYEALRNSPQWDKTLMVVVCDEWGGFADHVVPPIRPVSAAEAQLGNDGRLGFRTPCLLLGPKVKQAHVCKLPFDPSSIHELLRWRFNLEPLGARALLNDTVNLAYALDFVSPAKTNPPAFSVTQGVFGLNCPSGNAQVDQGFGNVITPVMEPLNSAVQAAADTPLSALITLAQRAGFAL